MRPACLCGAVTRPGCKALRLVNGTIEQGGKRPDVMGVLVTKNLNIMGYVIGYNMIIQYNTYIYII